MHFEFLVEEPSAGKTLHNLLPQVITGAHTFRIISYQGKKDLLSKLPIELKGYSRWIDDEFKIVVLIDQDNADCHKLKKIMEKSATDARLRTKTTITIGEKFSVLNRIAIEELEAWFFGDADAVRAAYPRVSSTFEKKASYRIPDAIQGGTWEALERILMSAGYFKTGLRKTEAASEISLHMQPLRNRSKSFQVFWEGITHCLSNQ